MIRRQLSRTPHALLFFVLFVGCSSGDGGPLAPPDDSGTIGRWQDAVPDQSAPAEVTRGVDSETPEEVTPPQPSCLETLDPRPVQAFFSKPCADPALCPCGPTDLGELIGGIADEADDTLDACVMELQDFSVSNALVNRHKAGVSVRVVLDDGYADPDKGYAVEDLHQAGLIPVTDDDGDALMHSKFLLVDGKTVVVTSANFSTYDALSNANNLILFESADLADIFAERFAAMHGQHRFHEAVDPGPHTALVDGYQVEVFFGPHWSLVDRLVEAIEGAEEAIHFSIFAFTLVEVKEALQARCGEVELLGIYDEDQEGDPNSVVKGGWCSDAKVTKATVVTTPGVASDFGYRKLHHKVLVVDPGVAGKEQVITGSANWSYSAATKNDEVMLVVHHPDVVASFESEFQARLSDSQ